MDYGIFSELEWVYPDTSLEGAAKEVTLTAARGGFVCCQIIAGDIQAVYEKEKAAFQAYQKAGQTFWFYSCSFPTGKIMDRVIDASLTVTSCSLSRDIKLREAPTMASTTADCMIDPPMVVLQLWALIKVSMPRHS